MAAGADLVLDDPVRIVNPLERIAFVAGLAAARLAGRFAQARWLPQAVARRRLRTRRTVEAKTALQIGVLRPQGGVLALKLRHPTLKRLDPALKPVDKAGISAGSSMPVLNHNPPRRLLQITIQPHFRAHRGPSDLPPPWQLPVCARDFFHLRRRLERPQSLNGAGRVDVERALLAKAADVPEADTVPTWFAL